MLGHFNIEVNSKSTSKIFRLFWKEYFFNIIFHRWLYLHWRFIFISKDLLSFFSIIIFVLKIFSNRVLYILLVWNSFHKPIKSNMLPYLFILLTSHALMIYVQGCCFVVMNGYYKKRNQSRLALAFLIVIISSLRCFFRMRSCSFLCTEYALLSAVFVFALFIAVLNFLWITFTSAVYVTMNGHQ